MNNQKHIVFFTPGFPENEEDTLCIPALQFFFRELSEQFTGKITVISFQYPYKENKYQWEGIDVFALGGNNSRVKKRIVWQKAKQLFKQLNNKQAVSKVHSFWMGECAFIASEIALKYNIDHTCTLMGQDVLEGNNYFKKTKKINDLISLSSFHKEQLISNYSLNSMIIPWGVKSMENRGVDKTIDLIGVGALTHLKGYNEFIEVVKALKNNYPNLKCIIIGDGPLRKELQEKINSLGLTNNIILTGLLAYKETQELIAQSKVLLHLSSFESFGMVTIEALLNNTQVIAKPVGVAKDIDEVVTVNSINEAIEGLNNLLKQPRKKSNYSFNYFVEDTVSKYLQLLNE